MAALHHRMEYLDKHPSFKLDYRTQLALIKGEKARILHRGNCQALAIEEIVKH